MHGLACLFQHKVLLELTHHWTPARSQGAILERIHMQHEEFTRPDDARDLGKDRAGHSVVEHVQRDVRPHRVEALVAEWKRPGHVGDEQVYARVTFGAGLLDRLG